MSLAETVFWLGDSASGSAQLDELERHFGGQRSPSTGDGRIVYYETFDGRLERSGLRLQVQSRGSEWEARLHELSGDPVVGRCLTELLPEPPGLVGELPDSRLRSRLEPIVRMRRLFAVAEVDLHHKQLAVLDDEAKTVVRVQLEEGRARRPGGRSRWKALPPKIRLLPMKGYKKSLRRVRDYLSLEAGLEASPDTTFAVAAAAVGLTPSSYTSKLELELDPATPSAAALSAVYRGLFAVIRANEEGVRADLDSEFLHDFRVSVRRTRVALGQMKACLSLERLEPFRREFAWLGKITGPTRDLDVYLLKMPTYRKQLPKSARDDLAPLSEFLRRHQRREQRRLAAALRSPRYRRLIADWEKFLGQVEGGEEWGEAGDRPIGQVAAARIWKVYRRVIKKGGAIDRDTPAEPIHRLRIDCKKLRYLMEFFRSLFPSGEIGLSIKALKALQDNLGDFCDYEVQQISMQDFSRQMVEEDLAPVSTLMAMGRLVERLEEGQERERRDFHRQFDRFAGADNARHFKRLFRLPGKGRVVA